MFTKLKEFFGVKKKCKYKAKNFTKSRINKNGHREVYDSSSDQWLLWLMIMDDTDYIVDFNSFEEVAYDSMDDEVSTFQNSVSKNYETDLNDFVETHVTESYTPSSYSPSSSSSSWSDSSSSSSYDSGSSSSSGGWD